MKKYMIFTLFLFVLIIIFIPNISAKKKRLLTGKTIVIDPGHGGLDPGTSYNEIYEKDINLSIALFLKKELSNLGANVIMTREGDYDLASPGAMFRKKSDFDNRIKLINESYSDLYISVHLNYLYDSRYFGPQVFYKKEDYKLASKIQKELNKTANSNRHIKLLPIDVYMYRRLSVPGVLIEFGFLSNKEEASKLVNEKYQKKLAHSVAESIKLFLYKQ